VPSDLPIACSLSGHDLADRLRAMGALGRAGLLTAERHGAHAVLRFRLEARDELAAVVAAEAECCAFLSMELDEEPDGILLTVAGGRDAEPVVRDLVEAFRNHEEVV
jgi:hypothetical protein